MRTNAKAQIELMLDELHAVTASTAELRVAIEALAATVTSDDGSVTITVDARGGLVDLRIGPDAAQRQGSAALAEAILTTARAAAADVHQRTQSLVAAHLPSQMAAVCGPAGLADGLRLPTVDSFGDRFTRGR